jgi:hypothetical protein
MTFIVWANVQLANSLPKKPRLHTHRRPSILNSWEEENGHMETALHHAFILACLANGNNSVPDHGRT